MSWKSWASMTFARLVVRREPWTLTWAGRFVTLAVIALIAAPVARGLCNFLSVNRPLGAQYLVVEGWIPPYAFREAAAHFRKGGYEKVIVVGTIEEDDGNDNGERGEDFGQNKLIKFGVPPDLVVTASPVDVLRDRTFHSAMSVRQLLKDQHLQSTSIDVLTVGSHARRSRLLFEMALGDGVKVGIISVEDRKFDHDHWWRSSEGIRTVITESIGYLYARVVFAPT